MHRLHPPAIGAIRHAASHIDPRAKRRVTITGTPDPGAALRAIDDLVADDAFEDLYRQQWSAVTNYASFRIGPEDAEDVAAEAFIRAWARRADYDPRRGAPATWLWGIVRNIVTDRLRRAGPPTLALSASTEATTDVADQVGRRDELRRAGAAIARLAEVDQEIIALRFGAGLTNREIAAQLGRSEGNIALRLHRAFRRVRVLLQRGTDR